MYMYVYTYVCPSSALVLKYAVHLPFCMHRIHIRYRVHMCVWMQTHSSPAHTNIQILTHTHALTYARTHALTRSLTQAMLIALLSGLCLGYTLVTVPFSLAFFWNTPQCDGVPTKGVDMFVDTFFLVEIVMTFFTGTKRLRIFSLMRDLAASVITL
jgi:hypothetical protein